MITNLLIYGIEEGAKKEVYMMTKSPKIEKISDIPDNTVLKLKAVAFFTDINEDSEKESNITSVMTESGEVYATNSATFTRELKDILGIMGTSEINFSIEKLSGISKNGREFVTCSLA